MDQEKIKNAVRDAAQDGKISCHDARELADKLGVAYREVGEACNELKIKVRGCELGCF